MLLCMVGIYKCESAVCGFAPLAAGCCHEDCAFTRAAQVLVVVAGRKDTGFKLTGIYIIMRICIWYVVGCLRVCACGCGCVCARACACARAIRYLSVCVCIIIIIIIHTHASLRNVSVLSFIHSLSLFTRLHLGGVEFRV